MTEELIALRQQGWTYDSIGAHFGVTRNAISGLVDRLVRKGLLERTAPVKRPRSKPKIRSPKPKMARPPPKLPPAPPLPPEKTEPVTIYDLSERTCRMVVSEIRDDRTLYCGGPVSRNWRPPVYCEKHARGAYHRPEERRR